MLFKIQVVIFGDLLKNSVFIITFYMNFLQFFHVLQTTNEHSRHCLFSYFDVSKRFCGSNGDRSCASDSLHEKYKFLVSINSNWNYCSYNGPVLCTYIKAMKIDKRQMFTMWTNIKGNRSTKKSQIQRTSYRKSIQRKRQSRSAPLATCLVRSNSDKCSRMARKIRQIIVGWWVVTFGRCNFWRWNR